jgi:phosphopantetheinyl transferase
MNAGSNRHLSLSDTGTHFVAALGDGVPVGVDSELHKPVNDPVGTLRRLGLQRTPSTIEALAPPARLRAFLRLWTAFEAYLKLERLAWDVGAQRFAALENRWQIGSEGEARFRRGGVGVGFDHAEVAKSLVLCVATPVAIPLRVHRMVLVTA